MLRRWLTITWMMCACTLADAASATKLRIGLLYSGDSFPVSWVQQQGYDKALGFELEIVDFMSAQERDMALQGGSLDGMNGDLVGASMMFATHKNIRITNQTLGGKNIRMAAIIGAPSTKGLSAEQLKGRKLGISPNTIIEYLADRLSAKLGVGPEHFDKTAVTNIPLRLSLVQQDKLDLGLLPEPLVSMGTVKGARIVVDDLNTEYSHAVLVFRQDVLEKKAGIVKKFMTALARATREINAKPESYREALAVRCKVPEAIKNSFLLYKYNESQPPSRSLFADVQDWLISKKKLAATIPYADIVDSRYLPPHSS